MHSAINMNVDIQENYLTFLSKIGFFIALSSDFYQEEEEEGGVDVTVVVRRLGNVPITVSQPVDFTLSIWTDGVDNPVEGTV